MRAALAGAPARRPRHPRNLIALRAGDRSLHPQWIASPNRDFDLFISYYGTVSRRYADDADFYEMRTGPKWPCIAQLAQEHRELLDRYDCVWFPDDDLAADTDTINRMFAFFHAHRLSLAQPALTTDSYYTWRMLLQDTRYELRFTRFIEVMAPMFGRAALRACAPSFAESASGWGLDWLWPRLCREAGLDRLAVIDATPVCHTRPCGGELYTRNPEMDPGADARRVMHKYGLADVSAVARYSTYRRVREEPLPLQLRLLYWLKRMNGRRRHARRRHDFA